MAMALWADVDNRWVPQLHIYWKSSSAHLKVTLHITEQAEQNKREPKVTQRIWLVKSISDARFCLKSRKKSGHMISLTLPNISV